MARAFPIRKKKTLAEGRKPGSGRKPGTKNKKTIEIVTKAAELKITPLEVMIKAMEERYALAYAVEGKVDLEQLDLAAERAKDCAPYLHQRMPTKITGPGPGGSITVADAIQLGELSEEELGVIEKVFARIASTGRAEGSPSRDQPT